MWTKGPWHVEPLTKSHGVYDTDGAPVAHVKGMYGVSSDERLANAHLIAAAPELYAALQDLIPLAARAMHEANRDGAEYLIAEELQGANAALAKARGE